jgi:hypothetical protein
MRRTPIAIALLVCLGVFAPVARATISEALSLSELVAQADHVVLATATSERARRDARGRIVTDFTVRIEEVLKGEAHAGESVVMMRLGGVIGDLGMRIEGEPDLEMGRSYLLFLRRSSDGRTLRPVGMSQGVMPVEDRSGELTVLPGGGGLALMQRVRGGNLVPAPAAIVHPEPYTLVRARVSPMVGDGGESSGTVAP